MSSGAGISGSQVLSQQAVDPAPGHSEAIHLAQAHSVPERSVLERSVPERSVQCRVLDLHQNQVSAIRGCLAG